MDYIKAPFVLLLNGIGKEFCILEWLQRGPMLALHEQIYFWFQLLRTQN